MKSKRFKPVVAVLATLDTKGTEVDFLKKCLEDAGVRVLIIDGGIMGKATIPADIPASTLAGKGGSSLKALRSLGHEGKAMAIMIQGAVRVVQGLQKQDEIQGIDRPRRFHGDFPGHRGHAVPALRISQINDLHHGLQGHPALCRQQRYPHVSFGGRSGGIKPDDPAGPQPGRLGHCRYGPVVKRN